MGTTLIINPGSSSKKFALYKAGDLMVTWRFEQTGTGFTVCAEQHGTKGHCQDISATEFKNALLQVIEAATEEKYISDKSEITTVGIRIVAPATYFTQHRVIDEQSIEELTKVIPLAPHHIPHTITELKRLAEHLPDSRVIGVSDSAFHATADSVTQRVSIPAEDAQRFDIKHFGYHGISVSSIVKHLSVKEGKLPERIIVCHIGSGVSVTAVQDGKSAATSMGYTPASGVLMSSRMGDVPADILASLIVRKGLKKEQLFEYLYNEGGFKGVAGVRDLRLVLDRAEKNDCMAQQALAMFAQQIKDHIAMYAMRMGGVDTIIVTATAAERNPAVRSLIVGELPLLHTYVHDERNEALMNSEGYIQTDDSQVKLLVLKTDELGEMFRVVSTFT